MILRVLSHACLAPEAGRHPPHPSYGPFYAQEEAEIAALATVTAVAVTTIPATAAAFDASAARAPGMLAAASSSPSLLSLSLDASSLSS